MKYAYDEFIRNEEMFDLSNYSDQPNCYDDSLINALVAGRMKGNMGGVASKEFVGLKPKMYSILANIKKKNV